MSSAADNINANGSIDVELEDDETCDKFYDENYEGTLCKLNAQK